MSAAGEVYEFAPFVLDVRAHALRRFGVPVELPPKLFDVLVALIRNAGRVIDKQELLDTAWPGVFVEEGSLARTVSRLRQVLGDARKSPRFIATVSKNGYRFVAPVRRVEAPPAGVSIAVLPFRLLGLEPDEEYLGVGLADALIAQLSQRRELAVRPTSSILRYADDEHDAIAAGRALRVDWVLDGTLRKASGRLKVSVQLVKVTDESAFWAARFEEDPARLLEFQHMLAVRIAGAVLPSLATREGTLRRFTADSMAYTLYLRGVQHCSTYTPEGLQKGLDYFERAAVADPLFALPHVGIAAAFLIAAGSYAPAGPAGARAKQAIDCAVAADPDLGDAYACRAAIRFWILYDRTGVEDEYLRAIDLSPNSPLVHQAYGWYLTAAGRFAEAEECLRRGHDLDPLSPSAGIERYHLPYFYSGRAAEAIRHLEGAVALEPDSWLGRSCLGVALLVAGHSAEGLRHVRQAVAQLPEEPILRGMFAWALAQGGERAEAEATIAQIEASPLPCHYEVATARAALGDRSGALVSLERAIAAQEKWVGWMHVDPRLNVLRRDPQLTRLARRAGF